MPGNSEIYPVVVDCSMSLADMITAGHYDWVNAFITRERFTIQGESKVANELVFVHLNCFVSTEEALNEIEKRGLRPATIAKLLAFGAKFPEKQKEFPIIALGSVWVHSYGDRDVVYLGGDASGRSLDVDWCENDWSYECRFLAVRNVA